MKRSIIYQVCFLVMFCVSMQLHADAQSNKKVLFFDDFNKPSLDRSKWNVIITGDHFNDELQAYIDSASTLYVENGSLVFRPQYRPGFITKDGQHFDFTSARITTQKKFDFSYGTAEAKIKLTEGSGLWPAWWLLGNEIWPTTGEVDIMEYSGEKDWASAAIHGPGYSGETPFVNRKYFDANNDATQWHIYAVDWSPTQLIFKYDGVPMFRVTKKMINHFGNWVFDAPKHLLLNFAVGGIFPVKINGIKGKGVRYGLPETTADLIKSSKAKMWVDWVKVSQ
ncbi:MAG: glycoside hydrolase family 16 protein [Chitinophagia bacterium]|jgi:beta-glucanase (GH16 family)